MKKLRKIDHYQVPSNDDILASYFKRHRVYNRSDARRIKRALHRVTVV